MSRSQTGSTHATPTHLSRPLTADEEERAVALHRQAIVVDTCGAVQPRGSDSSLEDAIAELRAGGVHCVGLTLAADVHDFRGAVDVLTWWNRRLRSWSRDLTLVTSADEVRQAREDGRIAVFYLFQNGKPFEDEPGYVELFRRMGVTSSQLTYNWRNFLGDGHYEPSDAGLSLLGREVVLEMNRVGMLVDLSHAGERTQQDAIRHSQRPVYFSHSNVCGVYPSRRNASDATLDLLASGGGMLNAMGLAVGPQDTPTVADLVDHVVYAIDRLGEDRVGLATDCLKSRDAVYRNAFVDNDGFLNVQYDGSLRVQRTRWGGPGTAGEYPWWVYPAGWRSYLEYPNVTRELVVRGLSDTAVLKVLGANFLALYGEVVG